MKLILAAAVVLGLSACSTTETIKETDVDGQCITRNVDRLFGVDFVTTEFVGDCS